MSVVFVAGVHGVGKTTACAKAASSLMIGHYAASAVIRGEKASAVSETSKIVADLDANQLLLINGVRRIASQGERFLLDGHFTLKSSLGIEPIPTAVFEQLGLRGSVLYWDHPEQIAARIAERDGVEADLDSIHRHQQLEVAHARAVANELSIPLVELSAFDVEGLIQSIMEWGGNYV